MSIPNILGVKYNGETPGVSGRDIIIGMREPVKVIRAS